MQIGAIPQRSLGAFAGFAFLLAISACGAASPSTNSSIGSSATSEASATQAASAASSSTPPETRPASWTPTGTMEEGRSGYTATRLLDGRVLVVGGCCDPTSGYGLAAAEVYDPSTQAWSAMGNTVARYGHTATLLPDGTVLVAGGYGGDSPLASSEVFHPSTGTWTPTGGMIEARAYHTATLLGGGRVLVAGGSFARSGAPLASAELYDPPSETGR